MIPLTNDQIKKYLTSKGIQSEIQKETDQVSVILKLGNKEYPLFFRVYEGGELLQLLTFLPCNTKEETVAGTARLLHLLNKEIDTPGFGMDEAAEVVFYRCMIPTKEAQVEEKLLDAYLNATEIVCQSLAPVIAAVAYGALTFEEVLKKSKEHGGRLAP